MDDFDEHIQLVMHDVVSAYSILLLMGDGGGGSGLLLRIAASCLIPKEMELLRTPTLLFVWPADEVGGRVDEMVALEDPCSVDCSCG